MESSPVTNLATNPAATLAVSRSSANGNAARFADLLPRDGAKDRNPIPAESNARKAAEQFVAGTLVLPILASVRNDPFKSEMFHGGSAEDAFGQQLDTILADRITASAGFGIVDSVYRSLTAPGKRAGNASKVDVNG